MYFVGGSAEDTGAIMPLGGAVGRVNPEGRAFRVDDNFRILMQWNRST